MSVETQHIPERTEAVTELAGDPDDVPGEVIKANKKTDDRGREVYEVTHEITVQEEAYAVYTADAQGKESRTYTINENDDGEWEVVELRKSPNRGHATTTKRNARSTPAVREAMQEIHDIELVN